MKAPRNAIFSFFQNGIRSRGEGDLTRDVLSLRVLNYTLQVRLGVDIYSTECDLGHRLSSLVESMVVIANRSSLL